MNDAITDLRRHVFRYDEHMPDTTDLSLIVLKGHLLVEEMLLELARLLLPHACFLDEARLTFHQLARVVRSAEPLKSDDKCWDLILALNSLRNELAHNLGSPKLKAKLESVQDLAAVAQPCSEMQIDKSRESALEADERVRHATVDCMYFLGLLIATHESKGPENV